jgi:hypothetical protein
MFNTIHDKINYDLALIYAKKRLFDHVQPYVWFCIRPYGLPIPCQCYNNHENSSFPTISKHSVQYGLIEL